MLYDLLDPRVKRAGFKQEEKEKRDVFEKSEKLLRTYLRPYAEARSADFDSIWEEEWGQFKGVGVLTDDTFEFWSSKASQYPIISSFARSLSGAASTEAAVERHFQQLSQILTKKKSRMGSLQLQRMMMISLNADFCYSEILGPNCFGGEEKKKIKIRKQKHAAARLEKIFNS